MAHILSERCNWQHEFQKLLFDAIFRIRGKKAMTTELSDAIKDFEDNYSVKDKQDLLAMCALQFASEAMGAKQNTGEQTKKETDENISYLNLLLDEYFEKENSSH